MELAALTPFLTSLGFSPSISTRPSVALLALSLAVNFSYITGPLWLAGWGVSVLLAGIVALEWYGGRNMALLEMIEDFMPYIKSILAVLVSVALLNSDAGAFLGTLAGESSAAAAEPWWQTAFQWIWSLIVGAVTWLISAYRRAFFFFFNQFDEDDDLGLLSLYTIIEYLFTAGSIFLVILVPIGAIFFFVLVGLGLRWLRKYLEEQEAQKMVACTNGCGTRIFGSALSCPTCSHPNPQVMRVGLLGQTTDKPATNHETQQWGLIAQKRCPRCATQFKGRNMNQTCVACQQTVLDSPTAINAYVAHFEKKLIPALIVSFVAGFIPILGVAVSVVFSRLTVVSPLRRYVSASKGCLGRWGLQIVNLILVLLQPIPVIGWITLPLMTYLNFTVYKRLMLADQGSA